MSKVYLAYARADEQRAEELRRILQAQGHHPWLDAGPIAGGEWHIGVDDAIQAAEALIVLVTQNSVSSVATTYEWAFALGAGLPVFAIIYEDAAEHPRLSIVHRYNVRAFNDENHFWDHFLAEFKRLTADLARQTPARPGEPVAADEIDLSVRPTEPGYWLVMRRGPDPNYLFRLERDLVNVGRDLANDIVIHDSQVSRYHFRLTLRGQHYELEDLGSSNGTRLNQQPVSGRVALGDGDIISIGDAITLSYDLVYPA